MQKLQINGEGFDVINDLKELSISKFNEVSKVLTTTSTTEVQKQIDLLKVLSGNDISEENIMDLSMETFEEIVALVNLGGTDYTIQPHFNFDNILFKLKGNPDDFKFSVNQMMNIHKAMAEDNIGYIANMMSFIYQNPDFSAAQRATIFSNEMTMDYVSPFLNILMTKYGQ